MVIYTLGPDGTNCAEAAHYYLRHKSHEVNEANNVVLYETLEQAYDALFKARDGVLLSCAAYPELHSLIFTRLDTMALVDNFIMPTHAMVLATNVDPADISVVATHPAPQALVPTHYRRMMANSNADAGERCHRGEADACITTIVAAERLGLNVIKDFGALPMSFLIHALT